MPTDSVRPPLTAGRLTLLAIGVYALARLITTLFVARAASLQVPYPAWTGDGAVTFLDMSVMWDGNWYRRIAEQGYPPQLPVDADGEVRQNAWAFYPAFPVLARLVSVVPGVDFRLAATLVSLVAGGAAAVLMVRLCARYVPAPVALTAMALWTSQPAAPALQIAYTEALATLGSGSSSLPSWCCSA